ncbi:hypothetical protein DOY81_002085 [Sarcophaga bullata]|nr:hypothetical protein DOY81_002085 [Sarcophaga bullata]
MKSNSKPRTAAASTAVAEIKSSATAAETSASSSSSGDCETVSRRYQAQVLGITIFGVVGFVVFIKYVVTKYFAELEAIQQQQHTEF